MRMQHLRSGLIIISPTSYHYWFQFTTNAFITNNVRLFQHLIPLTISFLGGDLNAISPCTLSALTAGLADHERARLLRQVGDRFFKALGLNRLANTEGSLRPMIVLIDGLDQLEDPLASSPEGVSSSIVCYTFICLISCRLCRRSDCDIKGCSTRCSVAFVFNHTWKYNWTDRRQSFTQWIKLSPKILKHSLWAKLIQRKHISVRHPKKALILIDSWGFAVHKKL